MHGESELAAAATQGTEAGHRSNDATEADDMEDFVESSERVEFTDELRAKLREVRSGWGGRMSSLFTRTIQTVEHHGVEP